MPMVETTLTQAAMAAIYELMTRREPMSDIVECPDPASFVTAGVSLTVCQEVIRRWPVLTDEEKQRVLRRIVPLQDIPLGELLE